jgi:hypothetical protein
MTVSVEVAITSMAGSGVGGTTTGAWGAGQYTHTASPTIINVKTTPVMVNLFIDKLVCEKL